MKNKYQNEDRIILFSILLIILALFFYPIINTDFDPASCLKDNNCLLLKGGTNKTICNGYSYKNVIFVDNWYNSKDLIDKCEMPPGASMTFAFKQHNQEIKTHTGKMKIIITTANIEDYNAVQILTSSNALQGGGDWNFCGNIDNIKKGLQTKEIICEGENVSAIKIVSASWNANNPLIPLNKGSIFLDKVEVRRHGI